MSTPHRSLVNLRVSHLVDALEQEPSDADTLWPDGSPADVDETVRGLVYEAANAIYEAARLLELDGRPALTHADMNLTGSHARLVALIASRSPRGGATDEQLFRLWQTRTVRATDPWPFIAAAGLRSRRAELVRWGLVEPVSGAWGLTQAGRRARLWTPVDLAQRPADGSLVPIPPATREARVALRSLLDEFHDDLVVVNALRDLAAATGPAL